MMIDCDKNMIVHLLRNWRPNRLRPQGFRLANERPRLITLQIAFALSVQSRWWTMARLRTLTTSYR